MNDTIIIPPAGKRTKPIIIQGVFIQETGDEKNERNEMLAKNFLSFGVMDKNPKHS